MRVKFRSGSVVGGFGGRGRRYSSQWIFLSDSPNSTDNFGPRDGLDVGLKKMKTISGMKGDSRYSGLHLESGVDGYRSYTCQPSEQCRGQMIRVARYRRRQRGERRGA